MSNFKEIYVSEVEDFIHDNPETLLLDVRQAYEFDQRHLNNAQLIPLNELEERIFELAEFKQHPVIVYCKAGVRSIYACNILANHGFSQLYNVTDGILGLYN